MTMTSDHSQRLVSEGERDNTVIVTVIPAGGHV
jgi:hypothetical protein